MIYVIDASVAIRWFLEDETHPNAEKILLKVVDAPGHFAVPELFAFEVFSVIQRLHPQANTAYLQGIVSILQSGILRHPMTKELATAADTYTHAGLTGYDACYAALAQILRGTWLTFDKKAHNSIKSFKVSHLLENRMPKDWMD